MPLPALLGGSPRTLGGHLRHSQLAGSTVAGLAVAAALSLTAGVHRSASKVLQLCAHSRRKEHQFRSVLMGSLFWQRCLLDWLCCVYSSTLRDGGCKVQSSARARSITYTVTLGFSLFLFAPGLLASSVRVVAYWRPHSTHSQGHRRRFSRRKVPGHRASIMLGRLSHKPARQLRAHEVVSWLCSAVS